MYTKKRICGTYYAMKQFNCTNLPHKGRNKEKKPVKFKRNFNL